MIAPSNESTAIAKCIDEAASNFWNQFLPAIEDIKEGLHSLDEMNALGIALSKRMFDNARGLIKWGERREGTAREALENTCRVLVPAMTVLILADAMILMEEQNTVPGA